MQLTKELLQEQNLEFTNSKNDFIEVILNRNLFGLVLNGELIKVTKTLAPIQNKLNFLLSL